MPIKLESELTMAQQVALDLADHVSRYAYAPNSGVKVGCVIMGANLASLAQGSNVEGPWQTSQHAEARAVGKLLTIHKLVRTDIKIVAIHCMAARRFTPCGACLDWLVYACPGNTALITQGKDGIFTCRLDKLYKEYPRK